MGSEWEQGWVITDRIHLNGARIAIIYAYNQAKYFLDFMILLTWLILVIKNIDDIICIFH